MVARLCRAVRRSNITAGRLARCASEIAKLIWLAPIACSMAFSQSPTTTISGTVYDPRATNALPLPNVLVYAATDPVAPLPSGVQCLTYQAPTGVVSYAYTAVDGTFTLSNIPEGATYTLVIQAGKWRRQFPGEVVGSGPVTGLALSMPADRTQGDIPMIAIVTGSVDGVECVLRDMGISDTEFTDDNGTVNPGGHIHLYKGAGNSGLAGGAESFVHSERGVGIAFPFCNRTAYSEVVHMPQGSGTVRESKQWPQRFWRRHPLLVTCFELRKFAVSKYVILRNSFVDYGRDWLESGYGLSFSTTSGNIDSPAGATCSLGRQEEGEIE